MKLVKEQDQIKNGLKKNCFQSQQTNTHINHHRNTTIRVTDQVRDLGGHHEGGARGDPSPLALRQDGGWLARRALTAHFPDVGPGLRVGDKLEPNTSLPDIACFEDIADFPAPLVEDPQ